MEDTRKVNGYTITNSMQIGEREFVLGENMNEACGNYYLVADFESNEIFERYFNAFVSDDYVEMASEYVKRITEEIEKLKENRENLSMKIITKENCIPINNESFIGKVIVLRAESLSPEYRNEQYQILLCTGGNGARPEGLGTSIFCKELFTGEEVKYRRANVMGILREESYPGWLKDKIKIEKKLKKQDMPER